MRLLRRVHGLRDTACNLDCRGGWVELGLGWAGDVSLLYLKIRGGAAVVDFRRTDWCLVRVRELIKVVGSSYFCSFFIYYKSKYSKYTKGYIFYLGMYIL
jgi:hypothetical protein